MIEHGRCLRCGEKTAGVEYRTEGYYHADCLIYHLRHRLRLATLELDKAEERLLAVQEDEHD